MTRRGVTLVELIVVGIITAGLATATISSISQSLRARDVSQARYEAFIHADIAARAIARDIANIVRDGDLYYTRFLLESDGRTNEERDELLVYARSTSRARAGNMPEGAEYEIAYRLSPVDRSTLGATKDTRRAPEFELWRRIDPVPDKNPEGGGVASPLTGRITSLSIIAFDGGKWQEEWDSDSDGYPHAVSITVRTTSSDGTRNATSRRIVAIDRTPVPYASVASPSENDEGGS